MRQILKPLLFALMCLPLVCHAWWDKDWTQRTRIVLNTSTSGASIDGPVTSLPVAVRLHPGNFSFADAKEDGADLRFVAGDDKTPLKFSIEHFDGLNEMAVVWVQIPNLSAKSDSNVIYAYYGNAKAAAEVSAGDVFDSSYIAVWHFSDKNQPAQDATAGALKSANPVVTADDGVLGSAATISGAPIVIPANDRLKLAPGSAVTLSMWVKPGAVDSGHLFQQGSLQMGFQAGKLNASVGNVNVSGGELKAAAWQWVAMTVGAGKLTLYLDGVQVAQADAVLAEVSGEIKLGAVYSGAMDEVEIANVARNAEYEKATFSAQGNEGKLISATRENQDDADAASSSPGYFGILVHNLTSDAWVVIGILMFMFAIAVWVMISKSVMIAQVEKANRAFLRRFREVGDDGILTIAAHAEIENSSLYRLYGAGIREVGKRMNDRINKGLPQTLNGASIDAIKASIDADQVRENHQLNSLMVLLTIAISGGPFLGLLGTVVGVMITFAAIAAAGDVNVNAIAPGIAAALLATVAGLSVAIPALFGYNWLAAKIRNISSDMQIFVDELVTRVAETYGD